MYDFAGHQVHLFAWHAQTLNVLQVVAATSAAETDGIVSVQKSP